MKLMTLNTHSLVEKDYEAKLHSFLEGVYSERPDVIALQEVNQTQSALPADLKQLEACGYIPCQPCPRSSDAELNTAMDTPCLHASGPTADPTAGTASTVQKPVVIRSDNHAFCMAGMLADRGIPCQWTWTPAKTGYGRYDEGLAVFSLLPVLDTQQFYITGIRDYDNWKTRKILGVSVQTERGMEYFYSVHMGWWDDPEDPFREQWKRICRGLAPAEKGPVWLMGDFNSPSQVHGEGRDLILDSGWLDTYDLASHKDDGITVNHSIDGWKERGELPGMRIDYIWSSHPVPIHSSRTIYNGTHYPVVSDHFGIIIEY